MQPIIDIKNNPFYCPAIPAHSFILSLRRRRKTLRPKVHMYQDRRIIFEPFTAALDRCLFKGGGDSDDDERTGQLHHESGTESSHDELNNTFDGHFSAHTSTLNATGRGFASIKNILLRTALRINTAGDSRASDSFVTVPLAPTTRKGSPSGFATLSDRSGRPLITTQRSRSFAAHTLTIWDKLSLEHGPRANLKRKSDESEFTYDARAKRARSTLSVNNSSFTIPREKLRIVPTPPTSPLILSSKSSPRRPVVDHSFDGLRAGTHITAPRFKNWNGPLDNMADLNRDDLLELARALQDELLGPILGPETDTQRLVEKLDSMLPGIRIKERLIERLKINPSHQSIVDFFAQNGLLNANILELFRASQVTKISLSESFKDVNGLNLVSDDSFFVFSKPNSFRLLTDLSLAGLYLKTPTLSHLQHLPKLAILSLFDTGIDNEAVYHLVPLKYTLTNLNIARNPAIDDDAAPALLLMTNLSHLAITETSIGMPGARKLVNDRVNTGRHISIDFPHWCHEYIATMGRKYSVELRVPFISNPAFCDNISVEALRRNLALHAAVNRDVCTVGTKKVLVERLRTLLETRLADLEVRRLIWNADGYVSSDEGNK